MIVILAGVVLAGGAAAGAAAAPCKPPQSAAMLTGPVYDSIQAECNWVDALSRGDAAVAAASLGATFSRVDSAGAVSDRTATLAALKAKPFGGVAVSRISVPFSAGSTNIVVSTWTFRGGRHRVTDVFFCSLSQRCRYHLIAEQITRIVR